MKSVTYILWSESTQRYYIGFTSNLEARLQRHNSGGNRSTKRGMPWRIVWSKESESAAAAMRLEKKIKGRGAERYLSDIGFQ